MNMPAISRLCVRTRSNVQTARGGERRTAVGIYSDIGVNAEISENDDRSDDGRGHVDAQRWIEIEEALVGGAHSRRCGNRRNATSVRLVVRVSMLLQVN